MFTGIIEATAEVLSMTDGRLVLRRPPTFTDVTIGGSIAVSGVCLSIVELQTDRLSFDVIPATLKKSTLGQLKSGAKVNLERAMRADGRFDGHIVQGHCEGVGTVIACIADGGDYRLLTIAVPEELRQFVVRHGSITIDGVSLTVAGLNDSNVSVALIPHTMKMTTLGALEEGDVVNLETDILAKYVLRKNQTLQQA